MRIIRRQPYDTPVPLPPEGWPLMVTFGDIADPATVQRVDPDDLAASFGCPATDGVAMPWRQAGLTYRQWVEAESERVAHQGASAKAGITGPAAAALEELDGLRSARQLRPLTDAETARVEELENQAGKSYTPEQDKYWRDAKNDLFLEFHDSPPPARNWTGANGGPCYSPKAITLEITRAKVTKGVVDRLLTWLGPYQESPLLKEINPMDSSLKANLRQGDFIVRQ